MEHQNSDKQVTEGDVIERGQVISFEDALTILGLEKADPNIEIVKKAWNLAVRSSANIAGENEGTDFGIEERLLVVAENK